MICVQCSSVGQGGVGGMDPTGGARIARGAVAGKARHMLGQKPTESQWHAQCRAVRRSKSLDLCGTKLGAIVAQRLIATGLVSKLVNSDA